MGTISPVARACDTSDHGYANRGYAQSLEEFGAVVELPACGGWLLARPVPGAGTSDGVGCYPMFCCRDWNALGDDLEALAERLVCASLVTDPLAELELTQLQRIFPDVCYAYKEHFVTDLSLPLESVVQSHHRRNVRKALGRVEVSASRPGDELLSRWQPLYDHLIRRHEIKGIARFSPQSFAGQMGVPGLAAFTAFERGEPCGVTLWYVRGDAVYYHLAAYSDRGYELGASFALFWTALAHFAEIGVRFAALGAGAGVQASESGLTRFKQGWATQTRPAYFCGRILQPETYQRLTLSCPGVKDFFPAYRRP